MRIIINILTKNYLLLDNHNALNNNSYHLHQNKGTNYEYQEKTIIK